MVVNAYNPSNWEAETEGFSVQFSSRLQVLHLNLSSPVHLFTSKSPESPKIKVCFQPDSSFLHRPSAWQENQSHPSQRKWISDPGSTFARWRQSPRPAPAARATSSDFITDDWKTPNDVPHPVAVSCFFPLDLRLWNCGHAIFPSSGTQDVLKASHTSLYPLFILCIYTKCQYLLIVPRSANLPTNTESHGNQQNRKWGSECDTTVLWIRL